ncbi:MAG: GH92 family glycosyl hydrolase [Bacteroidales bacterium]|nr:GH92 family glycosyl hydrolase [Bacteroidales bacterium]
MKKLLLPLVVAAMLLFSCQHTLTSYVNPFVGTDGHGHTFPGAILPFGMVQVSPDTRLDGWDGCSGYHYTDDTVYGFSHTHLSGTGCSDYGDLLIMPFTEENGDLPETLDYDYYKSSFSHKNEKAEPGYYRVVLDRNRVMAELTVHNRNALHKYTFPTTGRKGIVIDLKHRDVVINSSLILYDDPDGKTISGHRISSAWNPEQHFYFAIEADCDFDEVVFFNDGKRVETTDSKPINGDKAIVFFPDSQKEVTLRVGISAVNKRGAYNNLEESKGIAFQQAKKEAHATWVKALSQFEVEGGTKEDRANFYTALYHCMTSPYLFSDADGRYLAMKSKDTNAYTIQTAEGRDQYTVFSVWDTYRALHPLLNLTDPKRSKDFVLTMLDHYRHSGELTMWELAGHETHCMIGYHAVSVILDAYRTGALDDLPEETLNELLEAMVATSNLPMLGRTEYTRDNYLSSEYENESVSKTLEYAYDDWCIALFAKHLEELAEKNHPDTCKNYWAGIQEEYFRRCQSWKNIMDNNGFMHPRRNGAFITPFDPTEVNNHFTEANCWQYSSYVPHDIEGWVAKLGGDDKAEIFLDSLFYGSSEMTGRDQSDITGIIGQYAHGNEPSHHAAYLYAYIGRQWKTAELVRRICTELYHDTPDGLCGNEDCGQMSAWYVMSAMGFYPVCPGSGNYVIGSPLFDKVTIHLQNGKDIVINAKGQNHRNCYINSLCLNGTPYDKSVISFEQLKDGCTLDFEMCSKPNKEWGTSVDSRPHSRDFDELSKITLAPVFNDWQQSFDGEATITITSPSGDSIYYTLDGSTPSTYSTPYNGPITVTGDVVVKAVAYHPRRGLSAVVQHRMTRTQHDRKLTYITKPDPQYCENGETGLIDRLHGTENYRIGGWQGWQGDCEVVVDLLEERNISTVGIECLENMRSWIFFPTRVEVEISNDNTNWRPFGSADNKEFSVILERQGLSTVHNFTVSGASTTTRYVRIKAINYGKLPKWHVSAGEQAWLFVDEIEVK